MVIDHVHIDSNTVGMHREDHLLELGNPRFPIHGVRGIASFEAVVVLRIVAPVVVIVVHRRLDICLINRLVIVEGLNLDGGDSEIVKMIKTSRHGFVAFLVEGSLFGETKEGTWMLNA